MVEPEIKISSNYSDDSEDNPVSHESKEIRITVKLSWSCSACIILQDGNKQYMFDKKELIKAIEACFVCKQ
jgi:hypothetical protein